MSCLVHRNDKGVLKFVGKDIQDRDPLYERILSIATKQAKESSVEDMIAADSFLQGLYDKGLLINQTVEELALGLWAKAHQKIINTRTKPKKVVLVWRQPGNKVASDSEGNLPVGAIDFNSGESPAKAVQRAAEAYGKKLVRINKLVDSRVENGELSYYYDVVFEGEPEHTSLVEEHGVPPKPFYEDFYQEATDDKTEELRPGFFVSKETKKAIDEMTERSIKLKLDASEEFYVDDEGNKYQRVTTYINDGIKKELAPKWGIPSSTIGRMVDVIVRVVLADRKVMTLDYDTYSSFEEAKNIVTKEVFDEYVKSIVEFRDSHPELHFLTDNIKLFSTKIKPKGPDANSFQGVAGETDIIAVDRNGVFRIIDSKAIREGGGTEKIKGKIPEWTAQLKTYGTLLALEHKKLSSHLQILLSRPDYVPHAEHQTQKDVKAFTLRYQELIDLKRIEKASDLGFDNAIPFVEDEMDYMEDYLDFDHEYIFSDEELQELAMEQDLYDPTEVARSRQKFKKLAKSSEFSIKFYKGEISKINAALKTKEVASNPEKYKRLTKRLAEYQNLLDQVVKSNTALAEVNNHVDFENYAKNQLEILNNRIDKIIADAKKGDESGYRFIEELDFNVKFWKSLGKLDNTTSHPLLEEHEFQNERLLDIMTNIGSKADKLSRLITNIKQKILMDTMAKTLNEDLTPERALEILSATKDISYWYKMGHDIAAFDDELLSAIVVVTKRANTRALNAIEENIRSFDKLIDAAGAKLKWDDFAQKYADGSRTNRLVYRFTPEYQDARSAARTLYYRSSSSSEDTVRTNAYDHYIKWLRENEDVFNVIMLMPTKEGDSYHWSGSNLVNYTEEDVEKHKQRLIENLGQEDFDLYMSKLEESIEIFKARYELKKEDLKTLPPAQQIIELEYWEKENSPYWLAWKLSHAENKNIVADNGQVIHNTSYDILPSVPKRYKEGTKELTGYYDTRYENLKKDKELSELYDFMLSVTSTLYDMVPQKAKSIGENGLPFIAKDIVEEFTSESILGFPKELMDRYTKYITQKDYGIVDYQQKDPETGKPIKRVTFTSDTGKEKINSMVKIKMAEWEIDNRDMLKSLDAQEKEVLLGQKRAEFRKEARIELSKESSEDIRKVMNAYIMSATMYHHRAAVQDIVNMAVDMANQREAYVVSSTGEILVDEAGNKKTSGKAQNKIEALDHFQDSFYQSMFQNKQYVAKKKIYTGKEKSVKEKIEELLEKTEADYQDGMIDDATYNNQKKILQKELDSLGGNIAGSRIVDSFLKWVQLKGLGWNVKSAVGNMMFGYLANSTEAARGRVFNEKDLARARLMIRHSVIKSWSFGAIERGEAKKIKAIMERLDVLKDASTELEKASRKSKLHKNLRPVQPYHLTKTTEYVNQSQTAVAFLLNENNMLEDKDGNKITLYDAFDEEGRFRYDLFKEDEYSKDFVADVKSKIDQVIKMTHGNYDEMSPIMLKKYVEGRALIQFKTWFLESWRSRWGGVQKDHILGITMKGRYRSAIDLFIRAEEGKIENILDFFKNILRKYLNISTFGLIKTDGYIGMENLSKEDRENMQANVFEFIVWSNIILIGLMLKYASSDDDEDNIAANLLINNITRLQGDIELYGSPFQLYNLSQNLIPLTGLIKDMEEIVSATNKTLKGDYAMQSGAYEGVWRIPKEVGEALPITYGGMSVYKTLYNTQENDTLFGDLLKEN